MSSVFDPGRKDRKRAATAGAAGVVEGGSFSGPGGLGGNFDFSGGVGSSNFELGSFGESLTGFQNMSQQGFAQAGGDIPQELRDLGMGTIGQLGTNNINRLTNRSDFDGLGQVFQNAQATANADPFELGAGVSEKLRAMSERRNSRKVNAMFDRLKASGKLGTTGGAGIAAELDANIFDEGLKFDLMGLDAGRGLQSDAISRMFGASQGREQIGSREFGETFAQSGFENNAALQQFGVGNSLFDSFLQNQAQGANIAAAGSAGAAGVAQLPLAFAQMQMAQAGQASNSNFAQAGVFQNNASMAQSPIMNALTTAGSIAGAIAPGGFMGNPVVT